MSVSSSMTTEEYAVVQLDRHIRMLKELGQRGLIVFSGLFLMDIAMWYIDSINFVLALSHVVAFGFTYSVIKRNTSGDHRSFWMFRKGTPLFVSANDTHVRAWLTSNLGPSDFYYVPPYGIVLKEAKNAVLVKMMRMP